MDYITREVLVEPTPNVYELSGQTIEELKQLSTTLSPPTIFESEKLEQDLTNSYREALLNIPAIRPLYKKMQTDLTSERNARGYIIIDGVPSGENYDNMTMPTAFCALVGRSFVMAPKNGFWQNLGVDLRAITYRFQGVGENPFHIDAVNTTKPPDYLSLYGVRIDPAGGGMSTLSNLQAMVEKLDPEEIDYLQIPRYSEGQFYDMTGVGKEYKLFPVLEQEDNGLWFVRYTGKMIPEMSESYDKLLFTKIGVLLDINKESFMLQQGQLLIANQRIMAHGREPLGPGQEKIDPSQQRYLRQSYIRADDSSMH